jgi:hypothetical protein
MELIKCAIIEDNTVVNVVVVESLEKATELFGENVITITNSGPHIGWTRVDGVWVDPNAPAAEEEEEEEEEPTE